MKALGRGGNSGWGDHRPSQIPSEKRSEITLAARGARDAQAVQHSPEELAQFREALNLLGTLPMAALLRELGIAPANRDIARWRVLADISDELLDSALLEAKARVTEKWLAKPLAAPSRPATPAMRKRKAERAAEIQYGTED